MSAYAPPGYIDEFKSRFDRSPSLPTVENDEVGVVSPYATILGPHHDSALSHAPLLPFHSSRASHALPPPTEHLHMQAPHVSEHFHASLPPSVQIQELESSAAVARETADRAAEYAEIAVEKAKAAAAVDEAMTEAVEDLTATKTARVKSILMGFGMFLLVLFLIMFLLWLLFPSRGDVNIKAFDVADTNDSIVAASIAAQWDAQPNCALIPNTITLKRCYANRWVRIVGDAAGAGALIVLPLASSMREGDRFNISIAGGAAASGSIFGFVENTTSFADGTFNKLQTIATVDSGAGQDFTFEVMLTADGTRKWVPFGAATYGCPAP